MVIVYSDRYIISLSLFPHLHTPFSPSLTSLMVCVDVKHHVYLLSTQCRERHGVGTLRCARQWLVKAFRSTDMLTVSFSSLLLYVHTDSTDYFFFRIVC